MSARRSASGLALFALALVACNDPYSNDDILFLKALPPELQVAAPGTALSGTTTSSIGSGACAVLEQTQRPAKFYCDAQKTARGINDVIDSVLQTVGGASLFPPTQREKDLRVWGPFEASPGIEVILAINRVTTATTPAQYTSTSTPSHDPTRFQYALSARPKTVPESNFIPVLLGESTPTGDPNARMGWLGLNFEAFHALDPANHSERGSVFIGYDTRFGQITIDAVFAPPGATLQMAQGGFHYQGQPDGSGYFLFGLNQSIEGSGPAPETLYVAVRWLSDLRGRADAVVFGGDIPAGYFYGVSECWDPEFDQVYAKTIYSDPNAMLPPDVGEEAACGPDLIGSQFPPEH